MSKVDDYTNEQRMADVKLWMEDNLAIFKKKFILFFIGLCCLAVGIVLAAFGAIPVASIFLLGYMGCSGGPLAVKYWFSGFASIFDFQIKTYEVYSDGTKRDVSTIDGVLVGPFLKCAVAVLVVFMGTLIAPIEMAVRFLNHIKYEKKLGIKGGIAKSPRREAILCVLLLVVMFVMAIIGNIASTTMENTSDISDAQIVELLEKLESKTNTYKIGEFSNGNLREYAYITEADGTITFVAQEKLMWVLRIDEGSKKDYMLNPGTYVYKNSAWVDVDEDTAFILSKFTLGLALDFDAMKNDTSKLVVNKDTGLGYYYDTEQHNYYEIKPKSNSDLQFEEILVEENVTFAKCSGGYNYVYIFEDAEN